MLMVYLTESSGITEVSAHVIMQQSNKIFYELKLITPDCPLFAKNSYIYLRLSDNAQVSGHSKI